MPKSLGLKRVIAFAMAVLLMFSATGGAFANPGAALARGAARAFGLAGEGAAARSIGAGRSSLLSSEIGSIGTVSRPNLGAIGSGDFLASMRPSADTLSLRDSEIGVAITEGIRNPVGLRPNETLSALSGATLMSMCQRDEAASRAVRSYLYRQSRYHTARSWEREDLTQDTLVKLIEACSRFLAAPPENAPGYLAVTMKRVWIDTHGGSAMAMASLFASGSTSEDEVARIADPWPGPAERVEMQQLIWRAMATGGLSKQQEAVMMRVAVGNSREEISAQLGIGQERVKEIVAEARAKMRAAVSTRTFAEKLVAIEPSGKSR